jgi:uracil DNA glycosylase
MKTESSNIISHEKKSWETFKANVIQKWNQLTAKQVDSLQDNNSPSYSKIELKSYPSESFPTVEELNAAFQRSLQ